MKRASFTVRTTKGIAYDANHLAITLQNAPDPAIGAISVLSFVCSGMQMTIPATEIESITFDRASAQFCSECEQSIFTLIGAGIHDTMKDG